MGKNLICKYHTWYFSLLNIYLLFIFLMFQAIPWDSDCMIMIMNMVFITKISKLLKVIFIWYERSNP